MKQNYKISFLAILMCLVSISVMANKYSYDFEVDGIRYAKINETKVKVVTKMKSSSDWTGQYKGDIAIPKIVTYKEIDYMVTTIGESAFERASLTSITLPESITTIEENGFYDCKLTSTSIKLPESVTTIGVRAFYNCDWLKSINIPSGVTILETQTFGSCDSLSSIHIPDGITTIKDYNFRSCKNLKIVTGLKGVTSIGTEAFKDCPSLTEISIPENLETLGEAAFKNCPNLTSPIVLPSTLKRVEDETFYGCCNIPSITFSEGVQYLGYHAFYGCTSLTSIYIPASLTGMYLNPFSYCTNLTTIKVAEDNPMFDSRDDCNAIMSSTNDFFWGVDNLVVGCNSTVIPSTAKKIAHNNGAGAFEGCHLSSIRIPAGMTYAEDIKDCYIGEITVEEGNEVYDSRNNCNAIIASNTNVLTTASSKTFIPESVVEVRGDFRPYTEMSILYSYASEPPTLSAAKNKFTTEQFQKMIVYIPKGSKAKYESTEGWNNFWNFKEFDPIGIDKVSEEKSANFISYTLDGQRNKTAKKGVNIIRMSDGTTKTIVVK